MKDLSEGVGCKRVQLRAELENTISHDASHDMSIGERMLMGATDWNFDPHFFGIVPSECANKADHSGRNEKSAWVLGYLTLLSEQVTQTLEADRHQRLPKKIEACHLPVTSDELAQ